MEQVAVNIIKKDACKLETHIIAVLRQLCAICFQKNQIHGLIVLENAYRITIMMYAQNAMEKWEEQHAKFQLMQIVL